MKTNEILDALANASNCENAPPYLVTMAYQEMVRMQNVLISVDVAIDSVYPNTAPDVFEILKPMIKEFINEDNMDLNIGIKKYMKTLSDAELFEATEQAKKDLDVISKENPESDEHQNCFAGFLLYSYECKSRGLMVKK